MNVSLRVGGTKPKFRIPVNRRESPIPLVRTDGRRHFDTPAGTCDRDLSAWRRITITQPKTVTRMELRNMCAQLDQPLGQAGRTLLDGTRGPPTAFAAGVKRLDRGDRRRPGRASTAISELGQKAPRSVRLPSSPFSYTCIYARLYKQKNLKKNKSAVSNSSSFAGGSYGEQANRTDRSNT